MVKSAVILLIYDPDTHRYRIYGVDIFIFFHRRKEQTNSWNRTN
jgi:hypothetical protein